ncbi:alpha/beta hydrolase [Haladaptatus sp. SPP-AMP-3]|uniref:alpha/beta hydrolase n=1 Tax=Haladaptatus sp. SPP-AMP-3 TaxID=3121295 RepID=UPI003C2D4F75
MNDPDPQVRTRAADEWCAWEDTVISEEPNGTADVYSGRPPDAKLSFVRIATHYSSHGAWLEEGELLRDADRLAGIPGVLVHRRLDLAAPLDTAWELHRAWPDAELVVVDDAGHTGSDMMTERKRSALDSFAR